MLATAESQEGAFLAATEPSENIRQHSAVPLSEATRALYERLATLKAQWRLTPTLALRYEMAEITGQLWKIARNGNYDKNRLYRCPA